jgi:integrase
VASVSIHKRGKNSFRLRTRYRDPESGELREHTHTVRGTEEYAKGQKRVLLDAFSEGKIERLSKETVEGYLTSWVDHRVALGKLRLSSANTYRTMIRTFTSRFGVDNLVSLKPSAVEEWITETIGIKGAGHVTYACTILKTAFKAAVRSGLIPFNVFDRVTLPARKSDGKEITLGENAMKTLWTIAPTLKGQDGLAARIALETGMRRGEIAGLQWRDITPDGSITVRKTVVVVKRVVMVNEPKTKRGRRVVKVSKTMADELNTLRGEPDRYVFGSAQPPHPEAVSRMLMRALKAAGHTGFSAHDLRHAHATHLLRSKLPLSAVSKRLGHAKVTTTLGIYAHALAEDEDDIVDAMDNLLR